MSDQPSRIGGRPRTTSDGPHHQLSQRSSPELWGRMIADVFALPGVVEAHSAVSSPSTRAVLLLPPPDVRLPGTSLAAPTDPLEPVHLHGVSDTSIHLCLPLLRAEQVCALGWGEPHKYADHGTEIMVYGARDIEELDVTLALVRESLAFARG